MILTDKCRKFLIEDMQLFLEELENKINSLGDEYQNFYSELLELLPTLMLPYDYQGIGSLENLSNNDFINKKLHEFRESYDLTEDQTDSPIFDSIRDAYVAYREGGVFQLYKYREADTWYPKVIIDDFIGNEVDIAELGDIVDVYRGTSLDEYESSFFGQSWCLDQNIAEGFAYKLYAGQADYIDTKRVVLKTTIDKKSIYYYSKDDNEQEVIVDNRKIKKDLVIIVSKKISE